LGDIPEPGMETNSTTMRACTLLLMAGSLLFQQPADAHPALDSTGHAHNSVLAQLIVDTGTAVIPSQKVERIAQLCVLFHVPSHRIIRHEIRSRPAACAAAGPVFQDKFPRWSSSTFM